MSLRCRIFSVHHLYFFGVFWLGLSLAVFGELPSWSVRVWQTDDGLPENDVTGIVQSGEGYLWISTHGGLAQFDGVRFREAELLTASERTHLLIRQMIPGTGDTLWLALEGGTVIAVAPGRTNVFTGLPMFRPGSMALSRDGAVWIGYVDGSACAIRDGKVTRYTARSGLSGTGPCVVAADAKGEIWLAKAGRLSVFENNEIRYVAELPEATVRMAAGRVGGLWVMAGRRLMKLDENRNLISIAALDSASVGMVPSVVYEDRGGAVWVGTLAGGLFQVQAGAVRLIPTSYPDILSLAEDRESSLWVGTGGGGLNRLRPRVLELENVEKGLAFSNIRSVCEDTNGIIWAAAQNGSLARLEDGFWSDVSAQAEWPGSRVTCVTDDREGGIWVGTAREGLRHWRDGQITVLGRGDGLGGDTVRALLTDRAGDLWVATESPSMVQRLRNGVFQNIPGPPGMRTVRAIAQDRQGVVWMGTVDGALLRMDGDKIVDVSDGTLRRRKPVRCLYAATNGDLWIGYAGSGVGRFHDGKFSSLSTSNGLHDAYVCGLMPDDGGGFWFSSDHGIFQVRQRELEEALAGKISSVRSVLFGREEGLPSLQGNFGYSPGFMRSHDGRIWFPTRSGLVVVNPDQTQPNHLAPPMMIERVLVDGIPVSLASGSMAVIPPRHRRVEVEFTALSFVAPENVQFRYRLDGWDDGWIPAPRGVRSVSYTRLPAGTYHFRVTACNNAGIWNSTGASLKLVVEPFFWQTWWFRVAVLSLSVVGVAGAVRFYSHRKYQRRLRLLEQEALLQKERGRIAKDIHDELGANLTQISLLGKFTEHDLAEPDKARSHVEKIAGLARQGVRSVDEIVWAVNPRNDKLSQLLDYAGQYAVDFLRSAGIRCRIDYPEKVPARELPADVRHGLFMVVKEALNNAAKHSGADEILLRAELNGDGLMLLIQDNGRGFDLTGDNALADGLRNMRQRAAELGGSCEIESRPSHGTKVRVEVRLP